MKEKEFDLSEIGTKELSKLLSKAKKESKGNHRLYYYWIQSAKKEMKRRR